MEAKKMLFHDRIGRILNQNEAEELAFWEVEQLGAIISNEGEV